MLAPRIALLLLLPSPIPAQTEAPAELTKTVEVALDRGQVSLLQLSRAIADAYGWNGDALRFPDVVVPLAGARGAIVRMAIEKALDGTVRLEVDAADRQLSLVIDRLAVRALRQRVKRRFGTLLASLVGDEVLARVYALEIPKSVPAGQPLVICVHGVDASPPCFDRLREVLGSPEVALSTGTFAYANDEAIDRIANELSDRLRTLRARQPSQRVLLVGHSMGGLVCRYVLETPGLDPGNVDLLVMLGTPNHGSRLAHLRLGNDIRAFLRDFTGRPRLLRAFADGLGEAGWDLAVGSPLLLELNARPRNPAVEYRLLLGDRGRITRADLETLLQRLGETPRNVGRDKLSTWLADLDEVVAGEGDGAVSVERGRLEGVSQVSVLPLRHDELLTDPSSLQRVSRWLQHARDREK